VYKILHVALHGDYMKLTSRGFDVAIAFQHVCNDLAPQQQLRFGSDLRTTSHQATRVHRGP